MSPRAKPRGWRERRLRVGKIPVELLDSTVLRLTGSLSSALVLPPRPGLDFAAVRAGDGYIIVSSDPVTGVVENVGTHSVNVSANDVATSGSRPMFAESIILLPEGSNPALLRTLAMEIHSVAAKLGIAIVGGHTEVTRGLRTPIVSVTAFSYADGYISSEDAEAGDSIMMTKTAGIEGTAALANDLSAKLDVPRRTKERARRFVDRLSVVDEAVAAYQTGSVRAMHDCTEGGVLGAVFEMSLASRVGFSVEGDLIPIAQETRELCSALEIDPLQLIGSGSLLLSVKKGMDDEVAKILKGICKVTRIGQFTDSKRILYRGKVKVEMKTPPEDELWKVLRSTSRRDR